MCTVVKVHVMDKVYDMERVPQSGLFILIRLFITIFWLSNCYYIINHIHMTEAEQIMKVLNDNPTLSIGDIAKKFGISRNTLYKRINDLGIVTGRTSGKKKGYRKPLSYDANR